MQTIMKYSARLHSVFRIMTVLFLLGCIIIFMAIAVSVAQMFIPLFAENPGHSPEQYIPTLVSAFSSALIKAGICHFSARMFRKIRDDSCPFSSAGAEDIHSVACLMFALSFIPGNLYNATAMLVGGLPWNWHVPIMVAERAFVSVILLYAEKAVIYGARIEENLRQGRPTDYITVNK